MKNANSKKELLYNILAPLYGGYAKEFCLIVKKKDGAVIKFISKNGRKLAGKIYRQK